MLNLEMVFWRRWGGSWFRIWKSRRKEERYFGEGCGRVELRFRMGLNVSEIKRSIESRRRMMIICFIRKYCLSYVGYCVYN